MARKTFRFFERIVVLGVFIGGLTYAQTQTPGYIPRWLDDLSLSNSLIFQNGNRVGIGTETPADALEVISPPNSNRKVGVNTVIAGVSTGGTISFSRPDDGSRSFVIGASAAPADDSVIFASGGSTELRFVSGGLSS